MNEFENGLERAVGVEGHAYLSLEVAKHANAESFINYISKLYRHSTLLQFVYEAATVTEPVDRTLGVGEELSSAKAFYRGALPALLLATHFLPEDLQRKMYEFNVEVQDESSDTNHIVHLAADEIMDMGARGYAEASALHEHVAKWGSDLGLSADEQTKFERGFGFVISRMRTVCEAADMQNLVNLAESNEIDWDSALRDLLPPNE